MKKAIAEILAGVIPCSLARNRWRGLLRYGPIRAWNLHCRVAREKSEPKIYLAICAIAKNEGPSFDEWIAWHRSQGVEKFYIYDNESTDNTAQILEKYVSEGVVDYIFRPGQKQQLPAYDDCIERHRFDVRWLAFIDLDEFLVPSRKGKNIAEILRDFEEFPVVEANWIVYGSGGAQKKLEGSVMERFKKHSHPEDPINRHVKSIIDPRRVTCMVGCHEAARLSGQSADSTGKPNKRSFQHRDPVHGAFRINHYAVKSYEEFLEKRARGRARTLSQRGLDYFDRFDRNEAGE